MNGIHGRSSQTACGGILLLQTSQGDQPDHQPPHGSFRSRLEQSNTPPPHVQLGIVSGALMSPPTIQNRYTKRHIRRSGYGGAGVRTGIQHTWRHRLVQSKEQGHRTGRRRQAPHTNMGIGLGPIHLGQCFDMPPTGCVCSNFPTDLALPRSSSQK